MANPGISELLSTTLYNRTGKLADNVSKNNAILFRMKEKGSLQMADGGVSIYQEMEYAENSTYTRYSGYQVLNIQPSDVFTAAEFPWRQAAVAVTISGLEGDIQNAGEERVINLLTSRVRNAEKTMANNIASDMYSSGSLTNQIGGLQYLVADTPTNTVGGIDRNTTAGAFYKNYVNTGGSPSATTIQGLMNTTWLNTSRGSDHTDIILADNTYYGYYWSSLQNIQRITDNKLGQAGFTNVMFMSAPVVFDGGSATLGGACPSAHMYFLNTDYVKFRPHPARNFVPLNTVRSINQDATVRLVVFAGNMTMSNGALQGLIKA